MFKYIEEAERFYEEALKGFKRASEIGDEVRARDSCAKVWLALTKASEALFIKSGVKEEELPKGYRGQHYLLGKYGTKDLRRFFHSSYGIFHVLGYYEGIIDFERMLGYLDDVKEYIEKIKNLGREEE